MILALGVGILGGLGASLRYLVDNLISRRIRRSMPWGTIVINLVGSFGIGLLVGSQVAGNVNPSIASVFGVGLLGGFTTASTMAVEVVAIAARGKICKSFVMQIGVMGAAMTLGLVGFWSFT